MDSLRIKNVEHHLDKLKGNIEYLMASRRSILNRLDAIEAREKAKLQTQEINKLCLEQLCRSFVKDLERALGHDRKNTEG